MLQVFLAITAIYLYFFIKAIRLLMWIPGAIRKLKKGDTTFTVPFMDVILWALFSFFLLLSSLDALKDQPCWILCDLDANVRLVIRFIALYGILNVFLFALIGMALWQHRIIQQHRSVR
jgi:hypothetical protein